MVQMNYLTLWCILLPADGGVTWVLTTCWEAERILLERGFTSLGPGIDCLHRAVKTPRRDYNAISLTIKIRVDKVHAVKILRHDGNGKSNPHVSRTKGHCGVVWYRSLIILNNNYCSETIFWSHWLTYLYITLQIFICWQSCYIHTSRPDF